MIETLKGLGRVMMLFSDGRRALSLMTFDDGSWSIGKNGQTVAVWEPDERQECLRTFVDLAGIKEVLNDALMAVLVDRAERARRVRNAYRGTLEVLQKVRQSESLN